MKKKWWKRLQLIAGWGFLGGVTIVGITAEMPFEARKPLLAAVGIVSMLLIIKHYQQPQITRPPG